MVCGVISYLKKSIHGGVNLETCQNGAYFRVNYAMLDILWWINWILDSIIVYTLLDIVIYFKQ